MRSRSVLPTAMEIKSLSICLIWTLLNLEGLTGSPPTCLNGGTLYMDKNSATHRCLCTAGFTGPTCADLDPCNPTPCKNHGTCTHTVGSSNATCLCLPGYTGEECENEILPCDNSPCERGVCRNNASSYHCVCPPGYSGQDCQTYIGFCGAGSSPCNKKDALAVCMETNHGYTCECSKGYYGFNCESKLLPSQAKNCEDVGKPESYCLCSVNGETVKVPLERPRVRNTGVKSRDFLIGLLGLVLGWLLGTALLTLYYCCCYRGAVAGASGGTGSSRVEPFRPNTASSMHSDSTTLSNYMQHGSKPTYPPESQSHPPAAAKPAPLPASSPAAVEQSSRSSTLPTASRASFAEPPTRQTNIYRASFVDGMAHQVSYRKSPLTYNSASKDW